MKQRTHPRSIPLTDGTWAIWIKSKPNDMTWEEYVLKLTKKKV